MQRRDVGFDLQHAGFDGVRDTDFVMLHTGVGLRRYFLRDNVRFGFRKRKSYCSRAFGERF